MVMELVPLEGEEGGEGSFLGSICSQYSLGNLDASERARRVRKLKRKTLCHLELSMLNTQEEVIPPQTLTLTSKR